MPCVFSLLIIISPQMPIQAIKLIFYFSLLCCFGVHLIFLKPNTSLTTLIIRFFIFTLFANTIFFLASYTSKKSYDIICFFHNIFYYTSISASSGTMTSFLFSSLVYPKNSVETRQYAATLSFGISSVLSLLPERLIAGIITTFLLGC